MVGERGSVTVGIDMSHGETLPRISHRVALCCPANLHRSDVISRESIARAYGRIFLGSPLLSTGPRDEGQSSPEQGSRGRGCRRGSLGGQVVGRAGRWAGGSLGGRIDRTYDGLCRTTCCSHKPTFHATVLCVPTPEPTEDLQHPA